MIILKILLGGEFFFLAKNVLGVCGGGREPPFWTFSHLPSFFPWQRHGQNRQAENHEPMLRFSGKGAETEVSAGFEKGMLPSGTWGGMPFAVRYFLA
jgi:hypothetical protein